MGGAVTPEDSSVHLFFFFIFFHFLNGAFSYTLWLLIFFFSFLGWGSRCCKLKLVTGAITF